MQDCVKEHYDQVSSGNIWQQDLRTLHEIRVG